MRGMNGIEDIFIPNEHTNVGFSQNLVNYVNLRNFTTSQLIVNPDRIFSQIFRLFFTKSLERVKWLEAFENFPKIDVIDIS